MAVSVSALGLNCQDCKDKPDLKKHRGCEYPTEHVQFVIDGKKVYRCPAKHINPEIKYYIDFYCRYKKGHLPFRGSVLEQPIKMMEIFDILESAEVHNQKKTGAV